MQGVLAGKVAVFHPGTQHSWQTALALQQLGRLEFFATSLFRKPGTWPYVLEALPRVGGALAREFRRFDFPPLDPALVRTHGAAEWLERLAQRAGLHRLSAAIDRYGNRTFARHFGSDIASERRFALWGFNNAARELFILGMRHGRTCILDRTIGDGRAFNRIMAELAETHGEWFTETTARVPGEVIERAEEEYALADRILVGCPYAAQTIERESTVEKVGNKLEVLEYCFDEAAFARPPPPSPVPPSGKPVRFLFVGLGIPRKGIHHVLEAISRFSPREASLTVLGRITVPEETLTPYADRFANIPPVPRGEVARIMANHDVLLFPSLFEGAGLVLYEALAAGMALIQSDRAAIAVTPDTGMLLERPDTDLLAEAMRQAIADRERFAHWRAHAQEAAQAYRFAGYRERIAGLLDRLDI